MTMAVFGASGASSLPNKSLSFDGSSYLTMSDADWGSYNRSTFAIAGSLQAGIITDQILFNKAAGNEFRLDISNPGALQITINQGSGQVSWLSVENVISTSGWKAFLVHCDLSNATEADRIKMWVNNSAVTKQTADTIAQAAVQTTTNTVGIGANSNNGNTKYSGKMFQLTFFSGSLPSAADVFDGSSGKLKNLKGVAGAYSLLNASTATNDVFRSADWTNNGTVTTSTLTP